MKGNRQDVAKGAGKNRVCKMGMGEIDFRESRPLQIGLLTGGQELLSQAQVVSIVQDEQPACVGSQPALDGGNNLLLILLILFWEIEQRGQRHIVSDEGLTAGSQHPEHADIVVTVAKSVFGCRLRFADA